MADFRVRFTAGITLEAWEDPAAIVSGRDLPSRLNPQPAHGHTREVAATGVEVELTMTVREVGDAPLDAALVDGNLFEAYPIEWPGTGPGPAFTGAVGQSSVQRFTPLLAGHYTLLVSRTGHGGIYAHVDVDS